MLRTQPAGDFVAEQGFTYLDYLTRTAQRVGIASYAAAPNNVAAIPTDANRLGMLEQAIRDGVAYFARGMITDRATSTRWTWLEQTQTLTLDPAGTGPLNIDGDAGVYLLNPEVQSAPKGEVQWKHPTSGGGNGSVYSTDIDAVNARRDRCPEETGCPRVCAIRPESRYSTAQSTRYALVLHPYPDQAYTLRWRARVQPQPFTNQAERGIWPAMHDLAVVECCVAAFCHLSNKLPGDPVRSAAEQSRREHMAISIALDRDSRPRRLGVLGNSPPSPAAPLVPEVTLVNDVTGEQILP